MKPSRQIAVFTAGDLTLLEGEDVPTVQDLVLAERLGFAKPHNIRELILRNTDEIEAFGSLREERTGFPCGTENHDGSDNHSRQRGVGGRPGRTFYLNRQQAMLITVLSKTSVAASVRRQMIEVFDAYQQTQPDIGWHSDRPADALQALFIDMSSILRDTAETVEQLRRERIMLASHREDSSKKLPSAAAGEKGGDDYDAVPAFFAASLVADANAKISARKLFRLWAAFAARNHLPVGSEVRFAKQVRDHLGYGSERAFVEGKDVNAYHGFRVGPSETPPVRDAFSQLAPAAALTNGPDMLVGYRKIAEHVGMDEAQMHHLMRAHGLPIFRIGRRVWSTRKDLSAWLASKRAEVIL